MSRYIVLEQSTVDDVTAAATELAANGWPIVDGLRPPAGGRAVCVGRIGDGSDAARAVLAAVAGARLVLEASAPREVIDELCDDLRRLGEVDHRLVGSGATPLVTPDERALLELLLGGATIGEAARRLHISRRTADRRLAAARRALAAPTTAEALRAAARLGLGRR